MMQAWDKGSHFVGHADCRWGQTTAGKSRDGAGYVVSSVGEYFPRGKGPIRLGPEPHTLYESKVFNWDGEVCHDPKCQCGGRPIITDWCDLDGVRSSSRSEAIDDHALLVQRWIGDA